jgi:hypothetical protein
MVERVIARNAIDEAALPPNADEEVAGRRRLGAAAGPTAGAGRYPDRSVEFVRESGSVALTHI